jgi:thiamine-monophosphate kinase
VGEDGLLRRVFPFFETGPSDLLGPGDDAAVVAAPSGSVVVTTDTLVRDLDWRDAWSSPADVGVKAVTQNVADVAAMGAVPRGLLVTLVADPELSVAWAVDMARALADAAREHGCSVIGGDLSAGPPGVVVVTVTALGDLEGRPPVRRSGARPGDVVAVVGSLGLSAAGLRLLDSGVTSAEGHAHPAMVSEALTKHRSPVAPVAEGAVAARGRASAMIDLSDGLLRDAGRVALASRVRIDLDRTGLGPDVARISPLLGSAEALECVLRGGEEHSLLATFPGAGMIPAGWRVIGQVTASAGPITEEEVGGGRPLVTLDGELLPTGGWDHFGG